MTDRSITVGLVIVFLLLTLLIVGVGALSLDAMHALNLAARNIATQQWTDVKLSAEALDYSSRNSQINVRLFLCKDRSQINALLAERTKNGDHISALLAQLQTRVDSAVEGERLNTLLAARNAYTASYKRATQLLLEGHQSDAQEYLVHNTEALLATYHSAFQAFADFQTEEMNGHLDSSTTRYHLAYERVFILATISVLLALGLAASVIRKIVLEMRRRQAAENRLRQLNSRLEIGISERTASLEKCNRDLALEIAERKQAEALANRLSVAIEQSPVAIVITDLSGSISYVNHKFLEITGYSREEAIGQNPRILKSGRTPREQYTHLWQTIAGGNEWRGEFCNRKKNGELFWEYAVMCPIRDENGAISHYLAVKEDITERRLIQAQLQQAQKLESIGQLAAGIAHEINTPTQFVADNLAFLRDSWKSTNALLDLYRNVIRERATTIPQSFCDTIQQAERKCDFEFMVTEVPRAIEQGLDGARRVAEIVQAMKTFSHPDSAEKSATNLNKAIESTITVARNEWKYVADVVTEFDDSLPPVVCYPGDINQVVLNLLVNAAHAIHGRLKKQSKGLIQVRTRKQGNFAEISVTDNGTGIPEEIRSRVFDPFFTTKEVGKGTGQGLSMAYALIVRKHSGTLRFESETGLGTTFFIEIPIDPAEHRSPTAAAKA